MTGRNEQQPTADVSYDDGVVRVRITSTLAAPVDEVWAFVTTFAGVNAELMPWCRMVEPRALRGRTLDSYEPGERAACWILAGGVVPFDRHLLGLESFTPGVGFVEESTTWLQKRWRHERTLSPGNGASITTVVDQLTVVPRARIAGPIVRRVVPFVFRHRHRRLRARFGE